MEQEVYIETCSSGVPPSHQLAVVHCLRALCSQEFQPNSKVLLYKRLPLKLVTNAWTFNFFMLILHACMIFPLVFCYKQQILEDITTALNLWLSISTQDFFSTGDKYFTMSENVMLLIYNIIDLLSMKVCLLTFSLCSFCKRELEYLTNCNFFLYFHCFRVSWNFTMIYIGLWLDYFNGTMSHQRSSWPYCGNVGGLVMAFAFHLLMRHSWWAYQTTMVNIPGPLNFGQVV